MKIRLLCMAFSIAALAHSQTISPVKNANGKWALVDNAGNAITPPIYKRITATGNVGYIVENAATKLCGLFSYKGNEIIACLYDSIFSYHYSDELTAVLKNKKYGFINTKGQLVLVPEFDKISDSNFHKGFVTVTKGSELFVIDNKGNKIMPSPEPQESNYNRALEAANSTKERTKALADYINSIGTLGSSDGQKIYLIADKFKKMMDIDYHAYFETMMSKAVKGDDIKHCIKATQSLSKEQIRGLKALSQYAVDDFVATQNNKPAPPYPAGIPKPGYGWGKTTSSNKYVSAPVAAAPAVQTPAVYVPYEAEQKVGKFFYYDTSYRDAFGTYYCSVINYVEAIKGEKFVVLIKLSNNTTVYEKMLAFEHFTKYNSKYKQAGNNYITCNTCSGQGIIQVTSGGSHTNDYKYTQGQKTTYTWSTTSNASCDKCYGCGLQPASGYFDWKRPSFYKSR